jgi:hypothetical protein
MNKIIKTLKRLEQKFEINFGWFFVNGRKQEEYQERLRSKYKENN